MVVRRVDRGLIGFLQGLEILGFGPEGLGLGLRVWGVMVLFGVSVFDRVYRTLGPKL